MEQADILEQGKTCASPKAKKAEAHPAPTPAKPCKVIAAGLFGHSIRYGKVQSFAPISNYIRDLEQLPNFSPPSIERFVEQYVQSNIGITKSSS